MQLVVDTPGARLRRENGQFVVETPDRAGSERRARRTVAPTRVKGIALGRSTLVSADAILLALENDVEVLFPDRGGFPAGRVWNGRYGSVATIRKQQLRFADHAAALPWVQELLSAKLENQLTLLTALATPSPETDAAVGKIEGYRHRIEAVQGSLAHHADTLRGWEGSSGRVYFAHLSALLPEAYRFAGRSRRPATDMFNCLLNYAYGILYGRVEGALLRAGLDPAVGIFHRDEYNRPALAFDVVERFRVWAEYVVADLCLQAVVFREFFEQRQQKAQAAYWLNAEGKRVLIASVNDYLAEVVTMTAGGSARSRSRTTHLDDYAQHLAQHFKALP